MADLGDTIQEVSEHARESKLNAKVAIWVALTATFMAICDVKDGNIVQAMEQAQALMAVELKRALDVIMGRRQ